MRVILITLILFVGIGIGKSVNPTELEASIAKAVNPAEVNAGIDSKSTNLVLKSEPETYENPRLKKFVEHCTSHVTKTCSEPLHHESGISRPSDLALCLFNSMNECLVEHGASQLVSLQIFNPSSISRDIGISNIQPKHGVIPPRKMNGTPVLPAASKPIYFTKVSPKPLFQYQLLLIGNEAVKFQTILKTCTHVTAQTCSIDDANSVPSSSSILAACLTPSLNQCIYPNTKSTSTGETPDLVP